LNRYKQRIEAGLCGRCGKNPPLEGFVNCLSCKQFIKNYWHKDWKTEEGKKKRMERARKWRKENPEKQKALTKKYTQQIKKEIFEHYGKFCVCCGENDIAFLTLDHINNDGKQHREELGAGDFYKKIRRAGFPEGLQTMCWNCNQAKRIYGICPHQQQL
jgi:hypothetical protein